MAYLTPKLLLFVLHAVLGSVGFYLTLFYRQSLQLSLTAIGIAVAISAFGNLLAGPLWTIIIERYPSRHGQLLAVMMLTGTMSIVALRLAVDLIDPQYWQLASYMSAACYGVFALPCCALADYAVLKILGSNSILYGNSFFLITCIVALKFYLSINGSLFYFILSYFIFLGSQAVYGYVSKALCFLLVGLLIDNTTGGFDSAFYLWALSAILFTTLCLSTDVAPDDKSAQEVAESSVDSFQPLLKDNVYGNNYAYHPFEDQLSYISEEGSIHPTLDELERRQTSTSFAPTYRTFSSNPNNHMHRVLTGFDSLHHTSTAIIRDIHVKASFIIDDMENQVPSLGLALSHIPAADVVMSGLFPLVNDDNEMPPMRVIFATKIMGLSFMMLLTGISFSLVNTVLPIYLIEAINAPITWLAFLRPTGLLTEVFTFWMSKRVNTGESFVFWTFVQLPISNSL